MPNLVEIVVRAKDATKEGFGSAEAGASGLSGRLQKIGMVGGAALAGIAVASVAMAAKFDSSMELIHTQAGVAQNQIAGLKQGVLDLAGKVGFSPDSLAEALYHIESSFASVGIKGPQAMNLLKVAAEGAAVGHANLVDVTNALDAAIASGIPGVHNFQQAMGVLNATVGAGDMKMQDLADAFGTGALAVVKGFGLTIKDVGAALATYGDNNIRGAAAGTALRVAVQALAAPMAHGKYLMQDLGISANQLSKDMQTGGLLKAIEDIKSHMTAMGISATQQGQIITEAFGKKAGTGINILVGQIDRFKSKYADMARGAGQFGEAWSATNKTMTQQWKELDAGVQALAIQIGEKLMPYAQGLMSFFNSHKAVVVDVAIAMGTLAASLAVYAVAAKTAAAVTAIFDAVLDANPVTLIVLALAGLVAAFVLLWTKSAAFRDFWKALWKDIQAVVTVVWTYLKSVFLLIQTTLKGLWDKLVAWWNSYGGEIKAIWKALWDFELDTVKIFWDFVGPLVKIGWDEVTGYFKASIAVLEAIFKTMWDVLIAVLKVGWSYIEMTIKSAWDVIVGLFQVAIDLLTGHWSKAWNDLLNIGKQLWNNIKAFLGSTWNAIGTLAKQVFSNIESMLAGVWNAIEGTVKSVWGVIGGVFKGIWNGLKSGFNDAVSGIATAWNKLGGIFKTPVNFLINTVYMGGIRRLWDDVAGVIGFPDLPAVQGLAEGGKLPGFGGGDRRLALLEDGEAVVDKHRTAKYAPLLKAMGVPGFQGGGIVGGIVGTVEGLLGKGADAIKSALRSALEAVVPSFGSTELDHLIRGVPVSMIDDLLGSQKVANGLANAGSAVAAGVNAVSGPGGGAPAANAALARKMYPAWGSGILWTDWNNVAMAESGWNQFAQNPGGAFGIAQALGHGVAGGAGKYGNQYGGFGLSLSAAIAANNAEPSAQIQWMHNYIASKWGSPVAAWANEQANHWYGTGGIGGGMAVVGEYGRELVKLPHGSTVYSHAQSESLMARQAAAAGGPIQLEVVAGGDSAFEQFMLKALREWVRVKGGGNAQKAFGIPGK